MTESDKGILWAIGVIMLGLTAYAWITNSISNSRDASIDMDCGDFYSWEEAQSFYENNDPDWDWHNLDADGDGIACEGLK